MRQKMETHLPESADVCVQEKKKNSGDDECPGFTLTEERCVVVQITRQIDDVMICFS